MLAQKNMLYSTQKNVILHPHLPITATSPPRLLSSVPKLAVVDRFNCIITIIIIIIIVTFVIEKILNISSDC